MSSLVISPQRKCYALIVFVLFLPFCLYAQQCPASLTDSFISPDGIIEALRGDANLLNKGKDALVREAYEHGRSLNKLDLTDDTLFALIRRDPKIRSSIQHVINDDCKLKNSELKPIRPEELPKVLGSDESISNPAALR